MDKYTDNMQTNIQILSEFFTKNVSPICPANCVQISKENS